MKLVGRYNFTLGHEHKSCTVEQAVYSECSDSDFASGLLETVTATEAKTRTFLAKLVGRLHNSGALTDEDVLSLLPEHKKAHKDAT
jgi:hypothetical protein